MKSALFIGGKYPLGAFALVVSEVLQTLEKTSSNAAAEALKRVSPLAWQHVNFYGRYGHQTTVCFQTDHDRNSIVVSDGSHTRSTFAEYASNECVQ